LLSGCFKRSTRILTAGGGHLATAAFQRSTAMVRFVSILPLLVATSAHALVAEEQVTEGAAGPLAITIFALLFFGGCAWYAWLTWRNEKKDREAKAKSERNAATS
jgi:hypothetical protein